MHGLKTINRMNDWTEEQKQEYRDGLDARYVAVHRLKCFWATVGIVATIIIVAFTMV